MYWESDEELDNYPHPFIINGTRYLFKENPFLYMEEAAEKYFPEEVMERAYEISVDAFFRDKSTPDIEDCIVQAKKELAIKRVLINPSLLDWMKQDDFLFKVDIEQFRVEEAEEEQENLLQEILEERE